MSEHHSGETSEGVSYTKADAQASAAPVIHAWGINTAKPCIDLGTGGNKLHIGNIVLMQTFMVPPRSVSSIAFSGYSPYIVFPWDKQANGFRVTAQGAWLDSQTGRLNLSQAAEMTLPTVSFLAEAPKRSCCYSLPGYATFITTAANFNPAMRYTH
jgi:hypothetical protein